MFLCVNALKAVVAVGLVVLASTACASRPHALASSQIAAWSPVGGLSVPTPRGFHDRRWGDGVAISDGTIGPGTASAPLTAGYLPQDPNRVSFSVFQGVFHGLLPPHDLRLPVTLHDLSRASGGLTLWGGVFRIRNQIYGVELWLGQNATSRDRSTLLAALASIEPSTVG